MSDDNEPVRPSQANVPHVVVWGAGGHATVVAEIVRREGRLQIVGFLDDVRPARQGEPFSGSTILGGRMELDRLVERGVDLLIVGIGDCTARSEAADFARSKSMRLERAIHPSSIVAGDATIGPGTVLAPMAVIGPGVVVGDNVIVNTGATVDHGCVIHAGVHLSPGVHLGGEVTIGARTWIGIGACVIDHITIGERVVIGAGAAVVRNIPDCVVAYGVPARPMRSVDER